MAQSVQAASRSRKGDYVEGSLRGNRSRGRCMVFQNCATLSGVLPKFQG